MGITVKSQSQIQALLFGAGYTARTLIPLLVERGYHVSATTRDPKDASALIELGAEHLLFDGNANPEVGNALAEANILLSSIPPQNGKDPVISAFPGEMSSHAAHLKWAGYLSATSVYGDRGGHWAFEDELLRPTLTRGRARVEAELAWMESGAPVHVFRLAGIYGPGRNAFERLRNGTARAVIKPGHIVNRIHVDDICSAILAAIDAPSPMRAYNLSDGHPTPPQDVLAFAADLVGANPPRQVNLADAKISDMARGFYAETKRISNDRAKAVFGWTPQYETYEAGLVAILKAENRSI